MTTLKISGTKYYPTDHPAVGQTLDLEPDPSNIHDSNAIKILTLDGEQLGFVPAPAAAVMTLVAQGLETEVIVLFSATMEYDGNFSLKLRQEAKDALLP